MPGTHLDRHEDLDRLADEFLAGVAEEFFALRVDQLDDAVRRPRPSGRRARARGRCGRTARSRSGAHAGRSVHPAARAAPPSAKAIPPATRVSFRGLLFELAGLFLRLCEQFLGGEVALQDLEAHPDDRQQLLRAACSRALRTRGTRRSPERPAARPSTSPATPPSAPAPRRPGPIRSGVVGRQVRQHDASCARAHTGRPGPRRRRSCRRRRRDSGRP